MRDSNPLLFLVLATVFYIIGLGTIVPVLPFQVTALGGEAGAAPLIFSTFSAAAILSAPVWGWLSDRIGRRPVLIASAMLTIIAYLWQAHADSLFAIYACRVLAGLSAGWFATSAAFVSDVTSEADRAKGMGFLGAAFGAGFTIGPGLGASLVGGADPNYGLPAYAAAGFSAIALLIVVATVREPARHKQKQAVRFATEVLKDLDISRLLLLHFMVHLVFTAMEGVFAIWAAARFGLGAREVGMYLAFSGFVTVIVQGGFVRRIVPALGEGKTLLIAVGILALSSLSILLVDRPLMILLPMGLLAIGMGFHNPAMQSLLSQVAKQHMKGGTLGTLQSAQSFARVLGPAWGAAAFSAIGVQSPFLIGFVILAGATLYAYVLSRRFHKGFREKPKIQSSL